jgi:hypothetical protein
MSEEENSEPKAVAPSFLQRHDLGVLLFALAIFAGGTLITRRLATPKLIDFDQGGLHFERPVGWLPPQRPSMQSAGLARTSAGFGVQKTAASDATLHLLYRSARDAKQRIEVKIAPRPGYGNLRGARAVERMGQYGEFYWEADTKDRSIARRDWLRTEFRYAFKASKGGSPQIANAVEYATLKDNRLYIVTIHGDSQAMKDLDKTLAPTLRIEEPAAVEQRP